MKNAILLGIIAAAVFLFCPPAQALQGLSDNELDEITAGNFYARVEDGVIRFGMGEGRFTAEGDISVQTAENSLPGQVGVLVLSDNAQGNLTSFISVNAVNSNVQILINLNVNINSSVGELLQQNWSEIL